MENDTWVQENNRVRGQVIDSVAMWDNPVLTGWVPATNEILRVAADEVGLGKTGIGNKAPAGMKAAPTVHWNKFGRASSL